uniref:FAD/NAD(P)-binding domain-containing protein n=2 Tax=Phytophthora ramorum TaxID=164328 RepID=H3H3A1_PHYRM
IKAKYPSKNVTILESKAKLVAGDDVRDKFRTKLSTYLKRLGVKVVVGERLTERLSGNSFEKRTLRTDKGTEIESDVQLLCGGFSPTTELIQKLDASLVTPEGFVKVNSKLQLDSDQYSNIYALGDASNNSAPKRAFYAGQQGKHLGAELALVARKTQTNVSKPFPKVEVVATVLPLGPSGGVSQLPVMGGLVMGNLITKSIKSKDYFAGMTWKSLGAVVPN